MGTVVIVALFPSPLSFPIVPHGHEKWSCLHRTHFPKLLFGCVTARCCFVFVLMVLLDKGKGLPTAPDPGVRSGSQL